LPYEKVDIETVKKLREKRLFNENPNWRDEERKKLKENALKTISQLQKIDRESHFTRPRCNPSDQKDGYCNRCGKEKLRGDIGKIEYFCQTCWEDQNKVGKNKRGNEHI